MQSSDPGGVSKPPVQGTTCTCSGKGDATFSLSEEGPGWVVAGDERGSYDSRGMPVYADPEDVDDPTTETMAWKAPGHGNVEGIILTADNKSDK